MRVAVILAAGVGSRLRPLTDDRPKALIEIGGESIVGRAVRLLAAEGVQKVVLATGYREDALRAALAGSPLELVYCRNPRYAETQNAVSLALCEDAVGGEAFFKLDGDVVFYPEVLRRLAASTASLAVAVDFRRPLDGEAMKVRTEGEQIRAFGKQLRLDQAHGESIGIERLLPDAGRRVFSALRAALERGRVDAYYEDIYSELLGDSFAAAAVDVSDVPWTEVDTLDDLSRARQLGPGR